jgi:RecA-family ATPase
MLINAEDSGTEIQRRVWAFCMAHNIAEQNLTRLQIAGADDARVQRLSFLRTNSKNVSELDISGLAVLESALETLRPDVIVLDPLVAFCAGGNMNDNASMSLVMRELKRFAAQYACAVLVVHHT